jgi:imidazolonepropionase-like amidohydrolase
MIRLVDSGELLSPSIIPSGLIEGKSPFSNSDGILIENLKEAKQAVDYYFANGYVHIKIYSSFPKDLVAEIAHYSHDKGMTIGGHIPAFWGATEAIQAGFDEINHLNQVLMQFIATPSTDTRTVKRFYLPAEKFVDLDFDSPEFLEFIALLKKHQTVIDPTLAGFDFLKHLDGEVAEPYQSITEHLPPALERELKYGAMNISDAATAQRYKNSYLKMIEFTGKLYQKGVPIIAGTDGLAGFTLHSELALFVRAGLTPAQAIQIATYQAAKITQTLESKGSIEEGKIADLILVKGDPTQSLDNLRKISMVFTRGYVLYPNEIFNTVNIKPFKVSD